MEVIKPATNRTKLTFENYLNHDDGTDNHYELVDGELLIMNPPTGLHALIIRFLTQVIEAEITKLSLPWLALQNIGIRTAINRSRLPDLLVISREEIEEVLENSAIVNSAHLAIEIVSSESKTRDYRFKRSEYSVVGIPEYWIVDPQQRKVAVLVLVEGFYEVNEYQETEKIVSPIFPNLDLTVTQILQA